MEPLWCSQEQFIDMKDTQIKSNYIGSAGALCVSTILCLPRCVYILYLQIVCFSFILNKACSLFLRFFLETRRIFWSLPVHHISLSARSTLFWNFHDFHVPVFLTLASFFFFMPAVPDSGTQLACIILYWYQFAPLVCFGCMHWQYIVTVYVRYTYIHRGINT